jgi:hypothetical protein
MYFSNRHSTDTRKKLPFYFVYNKAVFINDTLTKHKIGAKNNLKTSLLHSTLLRGNTLASQMRRIIINDRTVPNILYNIIINVKYFSTLQFYFFKWQH